MEFTLKIPDSIYLKEPQTWLSFVSALQEMLNRMAMSYFKYHSSLTIRESAGSETFMIFTRQRMAMYDGGGNGELLCDAECVGKKHKLNCFLTRAAINSGNTENLLDAANGLVLERLFPAHSKAHFRSQRSDESPGITFKE